MSHSLLDYRQIPTFWRAILDSRNNLANQEIFRIAKAADRDGHRTIGIMTKLDALQRGDEPAVCLFSVFLPFLLSDLS